MGTRDKRIDAYLGKSADFAKPILTYLRELVHQGCPEVEETMKWSFPHFDYKGMMCGMASFKNHCSFGFWKNSLVMGPQAKREGGGMGSFGKITSLQDLPPKSVLLAYIKKAKQLNDEGVKVARPKRANGKKELVVPDYFAAAVAKNKKAHATFEAFPYSKKKDYVEWVTEAKAEETRARRLQTSVEWLAEGKARNWKYERC